MNSSTKTLPEGYVLSGDREGRHCIRINDQYRICFNWIDTGPEDVEIVDYHQG